MKTEYLSESLPMYCLVPMVPNLFQIDGVDENGLSTTFSSPLIFAKIDVFIYWFFDKTVSAIT